MCGYRTLLKKNKGRKFVPYKHRKILACKEGAEVNTMDDLKIFEEQNGSLQEKYNAWRKNAEKENLPQYKIDCAFQEARERFSLYCSLKETIPFLVMCRYELIYNLLEGTTM